jgi:hypothetical protein
VLLVSALLGVPTPSAGASSWAVAVAAGSAANAVAGALVAPTGVTGTCGNGQNKTSVVVTWTGAAHAATYTIMQSTTSATSGYSTAASGVAGLSWTSPAGSSGTTYWYEVVTVAGNWSSGASSATAAHTIGTNSCS